MTETGCTTGAGPAYRRDAADRRRATTPREAGLIISTRQGKVVHALIAFGADLLKANAGHAGPPTLITSNRPAAAALPPVGDHSSKPMGASSSRHVNSPKG